MRSTPLLLGIAAMLTLAVPSRADLSLIFKTDMSSPDNHVDSGDSLSWNFQLVAGSSGAITLTEVIGSFPIKIDSGNTPTADITFTLYSQFDEQGSPLGSVSLAPSDFTHQFTSTAFDITGFTPQYVPPNGVSDFSIALTSTETPGFYHVKAGDFSSNSAFVNPGTPLGAQGDPPVAAPEPATISLVLTGLAPIALTALWRRRQRKQSTVV